MQLYIEERMIDKVPFFHQVYFKLMDRRASTCQIFVEKVYKYLSPDNHEGMTNLKVGIRSVDVLRNLNDMDFDIVMDMEFVSFDEYSDYEQHPDYQRWVTEVGSMYTHQWFFNSLKFGN